MKQSTNLVIGDTAPDFELRGTVGGETQLFRLTDLIGDGEWVILVFYSFDFNDVCTAIVTALQDFQFDIEDGVTIVGISGDGIHAHKQFAAQFDIDYPLLSDTGKGIGSEYGVIQESVDGLRQVHDRSVFILDEEGIIQFVQHIDTTEPGDVDLTPVAENYQALRS